MLLDRDFGDDDQTYKLQACVRSWISVSHGIDEPSMVDHVTGRQVMNNVQPAIQDGTIDQSINVTVGVQSNGGADS